MDKNDDWWVNRHTSECVETTKEQEERLEFLRHHGSDDIMSPKIQSN